MYLLTRIDQIVFILRACLMKVKILNKIVSYIYNLQCFHCHDRMIVGFITTCTISAYHHSSCEFESCSGEVYL